MNEPSKLNLPGIADIAAVLLPGLSCRNRPYVQAETSGRKWVPEVSGTNLTTQMVEIGYSAEYEFIMRSKTGSVESRPPWRRWLRRIGLITGGLILFGLVALGGLAAVVWVDDRMVSARLTEQSRTHEGPLAPNGDPHVRGRLIELLGTLPSIEHLGGNGLRFVAMPSFGTTEYAVAVFRPDGTEEASGVLVILPKTEGETASERRFTIPADAHAALTNELRWLTGSWQGDSSPCLDGTPVAFELVREGRITSGAGNCSDHYRHISLLVLDVVRRFAPGDDLPTEYDWHRLEPEPAWD